MTFTFLGSGSILTKDQISPIINAEFAWHRAQAPVKPKPAHPELDLGDGRVLVLDGDAGAVDDWPVFSNN